MSIFLTNLHTHTTFSDGKNSIDETILAAKDRGFAGVGISDHTYTPMYTNGSIKQGMFGEYLAEVRAAKSRHPAIEVYAGAENEYCWWEPVYGLDYVIGSAHYIPHGGEYHCIDFMPEMLETLAREAFGGDYTKLARRYYEMIADMALSRKPEIIGHLDIIVKLNGGGKYFDTGSKEYLAAVKTALDAIARADSIIEVNTGAMARGYTAQPYPERHILQEILRLGIPVTVASDSHRGEDLDYAFGDMKALLADIGFKSTRQLTAGRFTDIGL